MKKTIAVDFGTVAVGKTKASVGLSIDRKLINFEDADATFNGRIITCTIRQTGEDADGQSRLPGTDDEIAEISGKAECKSLATSPSEFSLRLTFPREGLDLNTFGEFACRKGKLKIADVAELEEKPRGPKPKSEVTVDDHPDVGPMAKRNGKARPKTRPLPLKDDPALAMPLSILLKFQTRGGRKITKTKLAVVETACGGSTIGAFEKMMRENIYWSRELPGIGEEWLTVLQDIHLAFRDANPYPTDDPNTEEPDPKEQDAYHAAYTAGCEAAIAGKGDDTNPHAADSPEGAAWVTGHAATMAESGELEAVSSAPPEVAAP